jgi:hypothetical protein
MAVDITHNSATIRWTVPSLSYDPEIYVVQYGLAMDSLTMTSSMVTGDVTPLNYMDAFQGSVTLTDLNRLTTYFYRVVATNGGDSTLSAVGTFNTSDLGSYSVWCNAVMIVDKCQNPPQTLLYSWDI